LRRRSNMPDVVFVLVTVALFTLLALTVWGVERL
jgi:cytochrome oxidase assembly protein ShyY1